MSDDPLDRVDRAVRALRDEGDGPAPQAGLTRQRILRDLRPQKRSRRWVWAVPLAALLAGSTVLAATGQLPVIVATAQRLFGGAPPTDAVATRHAPTLAEPNAHRETASGAPATETLLPPDVALPDDAPSGRDTATLALAPSGSTRARPAAAPSTRTTAASTETAPPPSGAPEATSETTTVTAAPPVEDETLALYRQAHRLHFVDQNPSAALVAWDAYLAKEPKGPLVVDARYDRAVCLVRLHRDDEARRALAPFAAGRFGAYRQKDAQALLDALSSSSSPSPSSR
jgi:TolA-binding protein